MLWISHFGHPIAAAVDAAPMRRECDEVLARPLVVAVRTEFMSVLVRYFLFLNVKRGPDPVGCNSLKLCSAATGQSQVLLVARRIRTPCRNGSVLEALIIKCAVESSKSKSWKRRVQEGSNFVLCDAVYSDTRRKPKNAVVMAAHNMTLSSYKRDELKRFVWIVLRRVGVMGRRLGRLLDVPSARLIPLVSRYS